MKFGSLFSGIGGFDLAFERAGMSCAWQCEIDPKASAVLARHWPDVINHKDVKNVGRNAEPVDLICGGFPCQDLSVAGKRAGLAGERSRLWFEFARIIDELEPRWAVIENVPGLLSSNRGSDFAVILQWLANRGYGVAWRVLDAQYFGVAQRRRRVFIVASFGSGRAAEVLFEREGVRWDTPPRRKAGEDATKDADGISPTLRRSIGGTVSHGRDAIIPTVSAIEARSYKGINSDNLDHMVTGTLDGKCTAANRGSQSNEAEFVVPINTMAATRPEGSDENRQTFGIGEDGDPQFTLQANHSHAVAFNIHQNDDHRKDRPNGGLYVDEADTGLTLQTGQGKSHTVVANTFRMAAFGDYSDDGSGSALKARDYKDATDLVILNDQGGSQMSVSEGVTATLRTQEHGHQPIVNGVRRLTPTECERLQGFPDGWTDGQADSSRYRQLGNAVAVPVVEWIGKRIMDLR